jgi:acid phosphatase (class A)
LTHPRFALALALAFVTLLAGGGLPAATGSSAGSCSTDSCSCATPGSAGGNANADGGGSASASDSSRSGGYLLPAAADHYARLATLDASPRNGSAGLDRRHFALSAMSPGYLKILDLPPVYLDVPLDFLEVPAPPANSSEQTRAELDHLLALQASRTPEQVQRSQQLAGVYYRLSVKPGDPDWPAMRRNLFHMGSQLGAWFAPEKLPRTADFMARVWSDASYYLWAAKFRFNRIRPYSLEPRLQNLETPNFPAYPSGHSGNSWVAAYVYSELLPEHRELFHRNAADMAFSRELLGVHFASDSTAGKAFARKLVDRLLAEPGFQRDLAAARAEIAAVHAEAGCC